MNFNLLLEVGDISEMQKCGLKYVMFTQSSKQTELLEKPARRSGSDCGELLGANIYVYAADVYLVVQLG
jgi:hypothetical protein